MTKVHWIKLSIEFYKNRKIKYLRQLPEGNTLVLIWVMLLTIAGRCNADGWIFFTEKMPYTVKMLANELDVEKKTMLRALSAFETLAMIIRTDDGFIFLPGWEEHQNIEGLEKIREQNRLRKQRYDARRKALKESSAAGNVTVTQGNAADIEEDTEIETEKERKEESEEKTPAVTTAVIEGIHKPEPFLPSTVRDRSRYCFGGGMDTILLADDDSGGWRNIAV